jgi:hypothetical protein
MDLNTILGIASHLNTNRFFIGTAMIIMNLGSRYIITDMTKAHERLMTSTVFKRIILFCMFFVATRDVMISCMLTFAFVIVVNGFLNETKKFNLLPNSMKNITSPVSETEYKKALEIIKQYEKQLNVSAHNKDTTEYSTQYQRVVQSIAKDIVF